MAVDLKAKLRELPHQPGVYLMKDRLGSIIYVGKARDLKKRVSSYFMASRKTRADLKTRALIDTIVDFEIHLVRNEAEALLLEGKLIKDYRPRYNVSFRDDKRFLLVKLDPSEPWPRFVLTRLKRDDGSRYFGPFAHSGALRATISWVNRKFGLRVCRPREPDETAYKHCNADVIRNCSAPCVGRIARWEYLKRVDEACEVLAGKGRRDLFDQIEVEMGKAAERLDFEKAALLRDVLDNLKKTLNPTRQFTRGRGVPTTVKPLEDLAELGEELGLEGPPRVMECFDISNVSSNHIVASMVRFTEGRPDHQNYRRYRIRTVEGQDDFASMAEVIRRRYSRILRENSRHAPDLGESQEDVVEIQRRLAKEGRAKIVLPDLVIVDGGKGQLSSAVRELRQLGLHDLPIVGLAKQREEVFVPGKSDPILIPHERGALKLLQRIRDEAHRFANGYNELLYRRRMKESILDDCPGVSPRRKQALLEKFGSVERVRKATVGEIASISGISEKGAIAILEWLEQR
ncbi:excinuclease ABC subunit C [Haloferula luteola]|uniref:Excinuclease ABC subunit C n=1 Tax=Haloferula luteola TaxID=595692 RepID=A0A840V4R0_9BACT|nr:excinuclease ABC subunit UvrC [Haloferula luteola]MBB5352553.1 excinuclease ABC subunit C [Haloferula luteola]